VTEPLGLRAGTASSDHLDCESQPAHHVCTPSKDVRWAELRELEACVPEIWRASMSDLTMSTKDWLTIAEAMTQPQPDVNWSTPGLVASLQTPVVSVPTAINDPFPEMTPIAFRTGIGEYRSGFLGNNGGGSGQSSAFRFNAEHRIAIAVAVNVPDSFLRSQIVHKVCATLCPAVAQAPREHAIPDLHDFIGLYRAAGNSRISSTGLDSGVRLEIQMGNGARGWHADVLETDRGVVVRPPRPVFAISLFREPISGDPLLMLGRSAYNRVDFAHGAH
jgi:hypothetical protein